MVPPCWYLVTTIGQWQLLWGGHLDADSFIGHMVYVFWRVPLDVLGTQIPSSWGSPHLAAKSSSVIRHKFCAWTIKIHTFFMWLIILYLYFVKLLILFHKVKNIWHYDRYNLPITTSVKEVENPELVKITH